MVKATNNTKPSSSSSRAPPQQAAPAPVVASAVLAKRIVAMVEKYPDSYQDRLRAFCERELPSARMVVSAAQRTAAVTLSDLSRADLERLYGVVEDMEREFRSASEYFIQAAVDQYYR